MMGEAPMRVVGLVASFLLVGAGAAIVELTAQDENPVVEVYKTPT